MLPLLRGVHRLRAQEHALARLTAVCLAAPPKPRCATSRMHAN